MKVQPEKNSSREMNMQDKETLTNGYMRPFCASFWKLLSRDVAGTMGSITLTLTQTRNPNPNPLTLT